MNDRGVAVAQAARDLGLYENVLRECFRSSAPILSLSRWPTWLVLLAVGWATGLLVRLVLGASS